MKTNEEMLDHFRMQFESLQQELSTTKHLLEELLRNHPAASKKKYLTKLLVKTNSRLIIVNSDDIDWIEAWGDYVRIHSKGKPHIVRQKIGDLETQLDSQRFLRIGRSAIINADRIKEMESLNHGDYLVTLYDNTQLNLSRNFRNCLSVLFDNRL